MLMSACEALLLLPLFLLLLLHRLLTFRGAQLTSLVNREHLALLICAGSGASGSSNLPAKAVPAPSLYGREECTRYGSDKPYCPWHEGQSSRQRLEQSGCAEWRLA